jgi:hypothetical protein
LVGDTPPLGIGEEGFEALHIVFQPCDLTGTPSIVGHSSRPARHGTARRGPDSARPD